MGLFMELKSRMTSLIEAITFSDECKNIIFFKKFQFVNKSLEEFYFDLKYKYLL